MQTYLIKLTEAADFLKSNLPAIPKTAVVLGSGS